MALDRDCGTPSSIRRSNCGSCGIIPDWSATLPLADYEGVARRSPIVGLYYGHFATSFRMVFMPRIVNGTRSTFARGTVAKSDVPGFLRRHQ